MTNKLARKRFEQSLSILKHSSLMSHDEYCQMYKTLQKHLKEKHVSNENEDESNEKLDLRPFLYTSKDSYKNPFLFTLLKLMLELNRTSDSMKQKENLFRVYQWYCVNQKLLNPEMHAQVKHDVVVRKSTKSPIPSLTYSSNNVSLTNTSILTVESIYKSSSKEDSSPKNTISKTNKLLFRPSDVNIISSGQAQHITQQDDKAKKYSSVTKEKALPVLYPGYEETHTQKLLHVEISKRSISDKKVGGNCKDGMFLNKKQSDESDVFVPDIVINSPVKKTKGFTYEEHLANQCKDSQDKFEIENSCKYASMDHQKSNEDVLKPDQDLVDVNMNSYLKFLKSQDHKQQTCGNKEMGTSSKSLKKVVVELNIEKQSMQYNVHFPQEKPPKKNSIIPSGPVKPDTIRYQWTEHGFGGKTHLKKMRNSRPQTREKLASRKYTNPKLIASVMVSNHLGTDPRNLRYLNGDDNNVAQWIINHPELYLFHSDNVKTIKNLSSSQGYGYMDYLGHWCVDLTAASGSLQPDKCRISTGLYGINSIRSTKTKQNEAYEKNQEMFLNPSIDMQTFGKEIMLLRRSVGSPDVSISSPSDMNYDHIGSRLPLGASAKDMLMPNKKRDANRVSLCSRSSSARSRVDNDSKLSKLFNHYCLDAEYELDEETLLHREVIAAINIQKIFRGHMVRKYLKELKASQQQRTAKRRTAISFAEKNYQQHLRRMRENLSIRESNLKTLGWQKKYNSKMKQQEIERREKNTSLQRQQAKVQAKHLDNLKKTPASDSIHQIFHNNAPTKAQKREAAINIQKVVRGWLVRKHMKLSKEKALKRSLNYAGFVHNEYIEHCRKIMKRRGIENPHVQLQFKELLDYIERRNKFEVEYDRIAKRMGDVNFAALKHIFEECGLFPSRQELLTAINIILAEKGINNHDNHSYTKAELVDIAFQVYVPKGTGLVDTRKSTWMNPLINGEEAVKLIGKKGMMETNLEHCLDVVSRLMRERNEMKSKGIVPNLLPEDANREGFGSYLPESTPPPRQNKKRVTSARKSPISNKR